MKSLAGLLIIAAFASQAYSAPQFVSFKDGKLGVNFGGYHAAVGIGGLLGQKGGAGGGLFAEAGTPHGQAAKAGLGGAFDGNGMPAGGLYAGATAGGKVRAATGLAGGVTNEKAAGSGYAEAQAGNHYAASGLGGDASDAGSSGFTYSGTKSNGVINGKIDSTVNVKPLPVEHKKIHKEFNVDNDNVYDFVPLEAAGNVGIAAKSDVQPQTVVKEVYVHKHAKPRHHLRKTYIGGYVGGENEQVPQIQSIQKRIDLGVAANADGVTSGEVKGNGNIGQTYTKQVTFQRNPNFFADIFNIPISTLKAVGNFLGNTAESTNISVQKSGSVHAGGYGY